MNDERFQRLCQAQIEGTANEDERAELEGILKASEPARRSYAGQMRIHAMLSWQHGRAQQMAMERPAPKKIVRVPRRQWLGVAAAVLLLFALPAGWLVRNSRSGVCFEVVATSEVSYRVGERVRAKSVEIERGSLSFRLDSGAMVEIVGPVAVQLISPMRVRLLRGSLTADVGKDAKGFAVDTVEAHVVDLGTRFGVTAGGANATDVAVFEGTVEIYKPGSAPKSKPDATLIAGEAIRTKAAERPHRLKMIALGKDARSLGVSSSSDVVSAVTDNVTDDSFRGYYGLLRGGMGDGARIYTSGITRTWHPLPGEIFPEELLGADIICTFSRDRREQDLKINVTVRQPCDLYVMSDTRLAVPEWLRRNFVDTGLRLRSGPWGLLPTATGPQENGYVTHAVWKKQLAQPAVVDLGPPSPAKRPVWPVMYGIAVKRRP